MNDIDVTPTIGSGMALSGLVTRFTPLNRATLGKTTLRAGVRDGASDRDTEGGAR